MLSSFQFYFRYNYVIKRIFSSHKSGSKPLSDYFMKQLSLLTQQPWSCDQSSYCWSLLSLKLLLECRKYEVLQKQCQWTIDVLQLLQSFFSMVIDQSFLHLVSHTIQYVTEKSSPCLHNSLLLQLTWATFLGQPISVKHFLQLFNFFAQFIHIFYKT